MRLACGTQDLYVYAAEIPLPHRQVSPTSDALYPRHSSSQRIRPREIFTSLLRNEPPSTTRPSRGHNACLLGIRVIVGNPSTNAVLISPASPSLIYKYNSHTESHLSSSGAARV